MFFFLFIKIYLSNLIHYILTNKIKYKFITLKDVINFQYYMNINIWYKFLLLLYYYHIIWLLIIWLYIIYSINIIVVFTNNLKYNPLLINILSIKWYKIILFYYYLINLIIYTSNIILLYLLYF